MHEIQAIWGYMIVDDVIHVNNIEESQLEKYPDIKTHLHYVNRDSEDGKNIIICGKQFGTFDYDDKYRLTKLGYKKSFWELPDIFRYTDISYCGRVENPARFKSVDIGQEFVVSNFNYKEMVDWLIDLGVEIEPNLWKNRDVVKKIPISGIISNLRTEDTERGDKMAFAELNADGKIYPLTFFPQLWSEYSKTIKNGADVSLEVTEDTARDKPSYIVRSLEIG